MEWRERCRPPPANLFTIGNYNFNIGICLLCQAVEDDVQLVCIVDSRYENGNLVRSSILFENLFHHVKGTMNSHIKKMLHSSAVVLAIFFTSRMALDTSGNSANFFWAPSVTLSESNFLPAGMSLASYEATASL